MKSLLKIGSLLLVVVIVGGAALSHSANKPITKPEGGIKWMSLSEAEKMNTRKKKKIFIDIYTDWCGWCKRLDATTYQDAAVVKYVNDNYYAVKLNAETKDTISFRGVKYAYDAGSRINMVSPQFLGSQPGYPTLTYLDENLKVVRIAPGYVDVQGMLSQLKYIGENYYLNMSFEKYSNEVAKGGK
jgi:thioredoxin-related protein